MSVLASAVYRLSSSRWRSRDFTLNAIREALENLIAAFPVYRSYVDREQPAGTSDRRHIDWALASPSVVPVRSKPRSTISSPVY